MGMPAPKKRRVDLNDSFDEDVVIVNKNPNDSFDDDPMQPGPSVNAPTRPAEGHQNLMSQDIFSRQSGNTSSSTILTGGSKESGLVLMMKKRNENLTRQLEDVKREKVTKEMAHIQEKKELEAAYKKQLQNVASERDKFQRDVLALSFRQDSFLNMTNVDHNTTLGANKSFVPTRPVERKQPENPSSRLAWMKRTAGTSNVFKHPVNPNVDDTYVHFSTQMMESSTFNPILPPPEVREEKKPMVSKECQTEEEKKPMKLKASKREEIINDLLSTAIKIDTTDFKLSRLEELCRDVRHKPLRRNAKYVAPSSQDI